MSSVKGTDLGRIPPGPKAGSPDTCVQARSHHAESQPGTCKPGARPPALQVSGVRGMVNTKHLAHQRDVRMSLVDDITAVLTWPPSGTFSVPGAGLGPVRKDCSGPWGNGEHNPRSQQHVPTRTASQGRGRRRQVLGGHPDSHPRHAAPSTHQTPDDLSGSALRPHPPLGSTASV